MIPLFAAHKAYCNYGTQRIKYEYVYMLNNIFNKQYCLYIGTFNINMLSLT